MLTLDILTLFPETFGGFLGASVASASMRARAPHRSDSAHAPSPPISSHNDLVEWFAVGSTPKEQCRIATEHEKIAFRTLHNYVLEGIALNANETRHSDPDKPTVAARDAP